MNAIETVVFDLGNVLIEVREDVALDRLAARTGRSRRELDDFVMLTPFVTQLATGQLTPQRFYEIVAKDLGFTGDYAEFAFIWADVFAPLEPMLALARGLAGRYRRLILSNTNAIHIEFVEARYPILNEFDGRVYSHEEGCLKPDRRIYEAAQARYGLQPERTVFVDDLVANVEGARAAGWQAIQHRDYASTRVELTKLGVAGI
jgi:putative hydrolase of the HAD superfamily